MNPHQITAIMRLAGLDPDEMEPELLAGAFLQLVSWLDYEPKTKKSILPMLRQNGEALLAGHPRLKAPSPQFISETGAVAKHYRVQLDGN